MAEIKKNQLEENFQLTGFSNSRLNRHTMYTPSPKISFDRMTIVGNLHKENVVKLAKFMEFEPNIRLWDNMTNKFKAQTLDTKIFIEYDRLKAESWDRRNFRLEFNPNNLTADEMDWTKKNFVDLLEDDGFTRLDIAFDFEDDLSDYFAMSDKALKKTFFYGMDNRVETKYFGVKGSDRFIRIYNKKQERKDNADIDLSIEHLWRIEFELKRKMVDEWQDCFSDIHLIKPEWKTIEKTTDRAIAFMLLSDESEWGKIDRRTKNKFKKLLKEISPIDLTDLMKNELKKNEEMLQKQLDFWLL